jgi:hypothetical protein
MITVKDLIVKLLECNMNDEVIIKDRNFEQLHEVGIYTRKAEDSGLYALFG